MVAITLDGEEAALDDVRNGSGEMTLTVDYQMAAGIPYLAVSVLPLDVEHMRDVVISNGTVVNEGAGSVAIGWAGPGADESLELPSGFTVVRVVDLRQLVVAYVGRISLKREPQVNKPAVRALNYYLYKNFRHSTHTGI